jgi:hypothetical protein
MGDRPPRDTGTAIRRLRPPVQVGCGQAASGVGRRGRWGLILTPGEQTDTCPLPPSGIPPSPTLARSEMITAESSRVRFPPPE